MIISYKNKWDVMKLDAGVEVYDYNDYNASRAIDQI